MLPYFWSGDSLFYRTFPLFLGFLLYLLIYHCNQNLTIHAHKNNDSHISFNFLINMYLLHHFTLLFLPIYSHQQNLLMLHFTSHSKSN